MFPCSVILIIVVTQSDFCEHEWEYVGGVKVHLYLIFILDIDLYICIMGIITIEFVAMNYFRFLALKRPNAALKFVTHLAIFGL